MSYLEKVHMDCITATTFFVFPLISGFFVWLSEAVWFCVAPPSQSMFLWTLSCGSNFVFSSVFSSILLLQLIVAIAGQYLFSFTRQLLVPGYQEIWYTADGARKSSSPANNVRLWKWDVLTLLDDPTSPACIHSCLLMVFVFQQHCFYHGEVWGVDGSSVAVSTCSGLR